MDTNAPPLAYAVPESDVAQWRRVRQIVSWFAIVFGVLGCLGGLITVVSFAIMPTSSSLPWAFRLSGIVAVLTGIPIAIGGLMMLMDRRAGPLVLRIASAAALVGNLTFTTLIYADIGGGGIGAADLMTLLGRVLFNSASVLMSVPMLLFLLSFPLARSTGR